MPAFDQTFFLLFNLGGSAPPGLLALARFVGRDFMSYLLVATIAVAAAGRAPWRGAAVRALVAVIIASVLAHYLKQQFAALRPFQLGLGTQWLAHASAPGFPSSHAAAVAAWAFVGLAATPSWWLRAAFCAVALIVGWSRVALGLHFPVDVLAGWVVGVLSALAVEFAVRRAGALRHAAGRPGRIIRTGSGGRADKPEDAG